MFTAPEETVPENMSHRETILHVGPLPPPIGGMAVNVQQYLRSDVAKAFDIIHVRSDLIQKATHSDWRRKILNVVNAVLLVMAVFWRIVRNRPALVHIRTGSLGGFYEKSILGIMSRILCRRVIMHIEGGSFGDFYDNSSRPGKWLIRRLLLMNNRVIVLSEHMQVILLRIGVPTDRIRIIENAVFIPDKTIWDHASDEGKPPHPDTERITVIFLNRIDIGKGIMEFVDVARDTCQKDPRVQFLIYGPESPASGMVRDRIAAADMSERIKLVGPVIDRQKEEAYLSADIYVLPSYVEGMPIALLEAMSYGLPCIVSAVGGIPSVIDDGINGLLIEPRNIESLNKAMAMLIDDPSLRRKLGMQAQHTIQTRFSWDHSAKVIVQMYNELLSKKGAARVL